jgi:hypothetical protein
MYGMPKLAEATKGVFVEEKGETLRSYLVMTFLVFGISDSDDIARSFSPRL